MAKEIILYNLKDTVTDEEYKKFCEEFKGPFIVNLPACKSFTLSKLVGAMKGSGMEHKPPEPTEMPFKYIGIVDVTNLGDWQKDFDSKPFQEEFLPKWIGMVADFHIIRAEDVWFGQ